MISPTSRTLEWFYEIKKQFPILDIQLIEKTIRAFSLLESLVRSGCPFIFKGGTATMLHLNSSKRVSIDIDIICPPGTNITDYLDKYAKEYGFKEVKLEDRKSALNIPKTHGKFYYSVTYTTNHVEDAILLDVLFEDTHYSKIENLPIQGPFLLTDGEEIRVAVPSAADLLGDKLTAFAPHTTGIPYFKGKKDTTLEVVKQMFDISSLFEMVNDFGLTSDTYHRFVEVEKAYRDLADMETEFILLDTINTAQCLCLRGFYRPEEFALLQRGVKRIYNFIHTVPYNIDRAITDASRAAYLAASIMEKSTSDLRKYEPNMYNDILSYTIGESLSSKLNKLKKTNPEAFYYWAKTEKLLLL